VQHDQTEYPQHPRRGLAKLGKLKATLPFKEVPDTHRQCRRLFHTSPKHISTVHPAVLQHQSWMLMISRTAGISANKHGCTQHSQPTTATSRIYPPRCRQQAAHPPPHSYEIGSFDSNKACTTPCCRTLHLTAAAAAASLYMWLHKRQRLGGRSHHFGAAVKVIAALKSAMQVNAPHPPPH
jgi:hypothetical protein